MKLGAKNNTAEINTSINRAEDVRKRRTERSQQRVSTATRRAAHPVRVRPVVVRGNAFGTPIHRKASKSTPRRAFYVTMDQAAGSELRLPAIPMIHIGWRLVSAVIVILCAAGIFSLLNSTFFRIETVVVEGLQRISPEEVSGALNLENLSIIDVDASAAAAKLTSTFPELVGLKVNVMLPNLVSITAQERQPVIAWQKGDQVRWLDADGVIFPVRGEAASLILITSEDDLPLAPVPMDINTAATQDAAAADQQAGSSEKAQNIPVTGHQKVDPVLLKAAQALSQKLPEGTTLIYSHNDGLGWQDPQGWQVFIGTDLVNFEAKYSMYQGLVTYLTGQGLTPTLISVEHLDAPFYRLEP